MTTLGTFEFIEQLISKVDTNDDTKRAKALHELRAYMLLVESGWSEYLDYQIANALDELKEAYLKKSPLEKFRVRVFRPEQDRILREQDKEEP